MSEIVKLKDLKSQSLPAKKLKPLIVSTNESIIKVVGMTSKTYLGYNIFNESLVEVKKEQCNYLPEWIFDVLGKRKNRLELALQLAEDYLPSKAARIIDVGERELYRHKKSKLIEE